MTEDVERIEPADSGISEEWLRETDEPDLRAVSAARVDRIGGWQVSVWVMEFVRCDPLESQLRQRIASALQAVPGVTAADEEDREVWSVTGTPSGRALVEAVAQAVDDLSDRTRAYLNDIS